MDSTTTNPGCPEYEALSRRGFLGAASADVLRSAGAVAALTSPAFLPRVVMADAASSRDIFVGIFLRGGMDGLTAVAPFGDLQYLIARGDLRVNPPDAQHRAAVNLDGFFGLAPAMAPLLPAYENGDLLIVHAAGSPDPSRSHFSAQAMIELGIPLQPGVRNTGWLARHLQQTPALRPGHPFRAFALNALAPRVLAGAPGIQAGDPQQMLLPLSFAGYAQREAILRSMHTGAFGPLESAALSTLDTINLLDGIQWEQYGPTAGAIYPTTKLGAAMQRTSALIKADVGVEACVMEMGGWDTHANQGPFEGHMAELMSDLANTLAAFHLDMQASWNNITVVVMSEFGRRLAGNVSRGTDHGHGNALFVMGGHIAGGRVLANWPGLSPDELFEHRDLAVTIDYRDVLAEILQNRLATADLASVFPNYTPTIRGVTQ